MKLGDVLICEVCSKHKEVATFITFWEWSCVAVGSVKWLVDISDIVDQEPEIETFTELVWDNLALRLALVPSEVLDKLTLNIIKILKSYHGPGHIVDLRIHITPVITLIEKGSVNEMPVTLIIESWVLDLVSESSTLHKGIVTLKISETLDTSFQDYICPRKHLGMFCLQSVISHSSG